MDNNHSDQEEYEVEAIIGHRFRNGKVNMKNNLIQKQNLIKVSKCC